MFGFLKKAPRSSNLPPLASSQLRPRIKHLQYLKTLHDAGVPREQIPSTVPLCGELLLTYAFDLPDSFIMATPSLLSNANIQAADVARFARENLVRTLPPVKFFSKDDCKLAYTGGDQEATLLLVDALWSAMQADMAGELLVTVPRRDRLLMCDSANAGAVAALGVQTREFFNEHQDQHRLSPQIMVRRDQGWTLYAAH